MTATPAPWGKPAPREAARAECPSTAMTTTPARPTCATAKTAVCTKTTLSHAKTAMSAPSPISAHRERVSRAKHLSATMPISARPIPVSRLRGAPSSSPKGRATTAIRAPRWIRAWRASAWAQVRWNATTATSAPRTSVCPTGGAVTRTWPVRVPMGTPAPSTTRVRTASAFRESR